MYICTFIYVWHSSPVSPLFLCTCLRRPWWGPGTPLDAKGPHHSQVAQLPNQCQNACLPLSGDPKVASLYVSLNTNLAKGVWPWSAMLTYAVGGGGESRQSWEGHSCRHIVRGTDLLKRKHYISAFPRYIFIHHRHKTRCLWAFKLRSNGLLRLA